MFPSALFRALKDRFALALFLALLLPISILAQRPLGTDVSHYEATIDWNYVKSNGVTFGWAKATQGTGYTDPKFITHFSNATNIGIMMGAYHFASPSDNPNVTGANSADSEAAFYWSVVGNYVRPTGKYLVPMLDWEDPDMTNQLTAATLSSWVNEWCYSVSNYARGNGVFDLKPVIYTGTWYSKPSSVYSGLTTAVTIWPSWISSYPSNPNIQGGSPNSGSSNPYFPWTTWNIWQYADTNWSGGDADVFNGTAAQFFTLFAIGGSGYPSLISQPSNRTADRGGNITMSATPSGPGPFTCQWRFNATNIAGATATNLVLTNIQPSQAGSYTIVVSNSVGGIISSAAILTVNQAFTPIFSDNFETDSSSSWTLSKSSADTRAIFAYDYSLLGIPSAPNTTNGTTKGLRLEANMTATTVAALSASPNGQNFTGDYRLHFDMWMNVNGPMPSSGAGQTQILTAGLGTTGGHVQWSTSGADGVWFAADGDGGVAVTSATAGDFGIFNTTTFQNTNTGFYSAGTASTAHSFTNTYYANVFPGGLTPPSYQVNHFTQQTGANKTGTLCFAWHDVVINKTGTAISWYLDGLSIATVTGATLPSTNIFVGYWDPFSSLTDNTNLSFGLIDNLRVEIPAVAPAITSIATNYLAAQNSNVSLTVTATGTPPPSYQWRMNGTNISNATSSALSKTGLLLADAGTYSVIVSNVAGTVLSSNINLTVLAPISITAQTLTFSAGTGSNAAYTVAVTGSSPVYQWRKGGSIISAGTHYIGINNTNLTIVGVSHADEDSYSLLITNAVSTATSTNAPLLVFDAPVITSITTNQSVAAGDNAYFSVTASGASIFYRWRKNNTLLVDGGNITGAHTANMTLSNITADDAGSYNISVVNTAGSIFTGPSLLTVVTSTPYAPVITNNPDGQIANIGSSASFTVVAGGTVPLSYQWLFNGANTAGTNSVLTLSNIQTNQAGSYSVIVSNSFGSTTSSAATLQLAMLQFMPPTLMSNGNVCLNISGAPGSNYVLQVTTDLFTNWDTLATLTNTNGFIRYIDTTTTSPTQYMRYFRLAVPK